MQQNIADFLNFANFLADEASKISSKYFRQNLVIDSKQNNSPVTVADREIELMLRSLIKQRYPDHGIIGEEFANSYANSDYSWILDPIDGTVAFAMGKPTFTTLIALICQNKPLLSIIDQPISKERFCSITNQAAYLNQLKLGTSQLTDIAHACLSATTPYMFKTSYEQEKFDLICKRVKLVSFGGDAYAFGLLAAGYIDLIMEADLQYYDVAALVPLITASGGVISDWQGNKLSMDFNGQCLASANLILHQKVLALINNK